MISERKMIGEMNKSSDPFKIEYRKLDGSYGSKSNARLRVARDNALGNMRIMSRSGMLRCIDLNTGVPFDVYIDLVVKYNGQAVDFVL